MFCRSHLLSCQACITNQASYLRIEKEDVEMLDQIQRHGGDVHASAALFPFAGIVVGLAIAVYQNRCLHRILLIRTVYSRKSYTLLKRAVGRYSVICADFAVGLPVAFAKQKRRGVLVWR